jgi:NAD(P)-dependent dehydrogenase (short-subunit alcohol dehydrogenase family)
MGRMADPEGDIGELCVFLSSDKASYITGETFTVQGGSGLRP